MDVGVSYEIVALILEQLMKASNTFSSCTEAVRRLQTKDIGFMRLSYALHSLLRDLREAQKLLAYYVLAAINGDRSQGLNSFCTPLLDAVETANNTRDSFFVWQLLSRPQFAVKVKDAVPTTVLQAIEARLAQDPKTAQEVASGMKALRFESKLSVTSADCMKDVSVPPFLSMRDGTTVAAGMPWTSSAVQSVVDTHNSYMRAAGEWDLQPKFALLPPPLMDLAEDELLWDDTYSNDAACLLWDCTADSRELTAKKPDWMAMLDAAPRTALSPKQQRELALYMAAHPEQVLAGSPLTCASVPGLLEYNRVVCAAFIELRSTSAAGMQDPDSAAPCLAHLLSAGPSAHCLQVVSALSDKLLLPGDFVKQYASLSMSACEGMVDKAAQSRVVRQVCMLLQGMLTEQHQAMRTLLVEVQTFCLTFPRVKEATQLYRAIKAAEGSKGW